MKNEMVLQKISQAVEILKEKNIDMWLTFTRESGNIKDPMMDMIVGTNCTWQSAFIITKSGDTVAIVGSLEAPNMETTATYKIVKGYLKSVKDDLLETLRKYDPKKIAINFSRNSTLADGMTHGMYLELIEHLEGTPYKSCLISSEDIISALRGRKSEAEIALMKEAIKHTLEIFDEVTGFIKPGVTEAEIASFIQSMVIARGFGFAWDIEHCPAVFTGPDTAGAHSGPTDREVKFGHVLNIDFGINYKGYCSDLQRTWYICREGETSAPEEVMKGFNTIKESIRLAAKELKPGKQGCEIDDIARNYIVSKGYGEYPHALGHQIGRFAHDGGGLLSPRWERYGNLPYLPVEENQVFTIEPRLTIEGYGIATIEEEVIVKKDGCEFISSPQEEIYLIK
ncbi:MAG: aminopeptidase P family protein [Ignavibacteria bacterium]|nr:aminopeptidase P family protein [Ignavibacteria bacterium]